MGNQEGECGARATAIEPGPDAASECQADGGDSKGNMTGGTPSHPPAYTRRDGGMTSAQSML